MDEVECDIKLITIISKSLFVLVIRAVTSFL